MTPNLMVAMESVCLAFLMIILIAYIVLPRSKSLRRDWFFYSLTLTALGLVFDVVSWTSELVPTHMAVQYTANFFALITTNLVVSAFGYYVTELINEKQFLSTKFAHAIAATNLLGIAVTATGAFCGKLFDIKPDTPASGVMTYGDGGFFYELPMAICILSLAFLFILVLRNAKALGRQRIMVFSSYFLLPLLAGVLVLFSTNILLSYVAVSVSMCIIYVMLQSSHINELMLRDKLLNEISYVDQLTGLLNRRAYDRDVDCTHKDDTVSVVFCDLNGLKKINDEKGHSAGDQFLISFSKILTRHFPHDSVYRISGDEFVVMTRNMGAEEFESNISRLRQEIDKNAGIAALGTITGTGDTVPMLVRKAEMSMYADKKNFYRHNPSYSRGKSVYMEMETEAAE